MRILLWLLVLANVSAFAYFNRDALTVSSVSLTKPDLNADQLKVLTEQEVNAMPKRGAFAPTVDLPTISEVQEVAPEPMLATTETTLAQTPTTSTPAVPKPAATPAILDNKSEAKNETKSEPKPEVKSEAKMEAKTEAKLCYEWSSFDLSSVAEAASRANRLDIKTIVNQQNTADVSVRYWVYKPPLASAELAQRKAEELRSMGINDFYVVQESKWRNAISFGVFKDEQLAINLMNTLKNKGVRELVKSVRNKGDGNAAIRLLNVSPQQYIQIQKLLPNFPDTGIKEVPCN